MNDAPTYQISVTRQVEGDDDDEPLRRAVEAALRHHGVSQAAVSVAVVDDASIARLHGAYLHQPTPTDVLTFDLRDAHSDPVEGEIVISAETADREARRRGHRPSAELMLYAVHGTLHLLGYDDHRPDEAARMHAVEDAILSGLGVGPVYATAGRIRGEA